jgi:hypothetical protein
MSTISSTPSPKGMSQSRRVCGGTSGWSGASNLKGSQWLLCMMAFARSHIVSEKTPYMYGQSLPLKLRCSHMRRILNSGSCVQVCNAVAALRCIC